MRGRFITFEGGEGTGKSTHASILASRLRSFGIQTKLTREPGGSPGAEIMRYVLLSGAARPLGPNAEAVLFAAARDDHLTTLIRPALAQGKWVVCDRFADSTRAYQGAGGGVSPEFIAQVERAVVGDNCPDLTLVFDLPPEQGLERAFGRDMFSEVRFESKGLDFHNRLRAAYLAIAKAEPERCVLIDASGDREAVSELVWATVMERLGS